MIHFTKMDQYWSFWCQGWSTHQNQEVLWWNRAVEVGEANEVADADEADEVNEAAEVVRSEKSLLRTSVSSRFLNLALLWCFEKKNVLVESWKFMSNFSTLSVRGCWGQPILLFWKLVDKTQISKPPEPTRHHNSIKLWILLSLRADLLYILQYETPCRSWHIGIFGLLIGLQYNESFCNLPLLTRTKKSNKSHYWRK